MGKVRQCRECGGGFEAVKKTGKMETVAYHPRRFCSTECRKAFNNRRAMRGAELYDLFRAIRRERETSKEMNLWTKACRLEEKWQEEDERERPGRRSYLPPREAFLQLAGAGKISIRPTPAEDEAFRERVRARDKKRDAEYRAKREAEHKEVTP